jgi:hypothetical protein
MRIEKSLADILDELAALPPASTVETVDGGALVIHLPDGKLVEVLTHSHVDSAS